VAELAARRVGAKTRQRIQHYALTEPSFTIPFAAWELDLSDTCVRHVVMDMLRAGQIEQIEERERRYNLSAVYQAKRRESGDAAGDDDHHAQRELDRPQAGVDDRWNRDRAPVGSRQRGHGA
jgi:hypothetical protein